MSSSYRMSALIGGLVLLATVAVYVLVQGDGTATSDIAQVESPDSSDQGLPDGDAMSDAGGHLTESDGREGNTLTGEGPSKDEDVAEPEESAANEEAKDEQESDGKPLTVRDRPDWDRFKKLPVGGPREPAKPEYDSSLDESNWQLYDMTPALEYRHKLSQLFKIDRSRHAYRNLRGRVFEIVGNTRIPLSGVIVSDRRGTRTFTDEEGRFEFLAYVNETDDRNSVKEGEEYTVYLSARAHGHVDFGFRRRYSSLDQGDDGFEIYLARRDSQRIRIGFDNPQVAGGPVTVVLARNDDKGHPSQARAKDWDERRYIVADVRPSEGAWFTVPLEYAPRNGESMFVLRSVSAPNILADAKTLRPVSKSYEEYVYNVRLVVEDTVTVSGTVTDMRTGKPLPNARVYGPGRTEFTVADEQGRFELITARTPKGPDGKPVNEGGRFIHIAHEGYAPIRTLIKDGTLSNTLTGGISPEGGSLAGPWEFRLRPFVSVEIDCTGLHEAFLENGKVGLPGDVTATSRFYVGGGWWRIDENPVREAEFFPWGLEEMRVENFERRPRPQPGERPPKLPRGPVKVPPECWQGDEPYRLKLEH